MFVKALVKTQKGEGFVEIPDRFAPAIGDDEGLGCAVSYAFRLQ